MSLESPMLGIEEAACLQKHPCLQAQKGPRLKPPLNWTRSKFLVLMFCTTLTSESHFIHTHPPPLKIPFLGLLCAGGGEKIGDRDRGVKSLKIGGEVKISSFQGSLNLTPFYRDCIEIPQFGVKSPSFPRTTFGASSPPPLAFGTF